MQRVFMDLIYGTYLRIMCSELIRLGTLQLELCLNCQIFVIDILLNQCTVTVLGGTTILLNI